MCRLVSTSFERNTPLNLCVTNQWLAAQQSDRSVIDALFAADV